MRLPQASVENLFTLSEMTPNNRRLWLLDILTLLFAACSGVGFGYVFLRIFAPSFLDKITIFGFGS